MHVGLVVSVSAVLAFSHVQTRLLLPGARDEIYQRWRPRGLAARASAFIYSRREAANVPMMTPSSIDPKVRL